MSCRYELIDGGRAEFWEAVIDSASGDRAFTVTSGAIGTAGKTESHYFPNPEHAMSLFRKLKIDCERRGFQRVAPGLPALAPSPRNLQLETAVVSSRGDTSAMLVYADWLQQQGLTLGEVIALACAGRETEASARIVAKSAELLGGLDAYDVLSNVIWENGVVIGVRLSDDKPEMGIPLAAAVARILRLPATRFLRRLSVGWSRDSGYEASPHFPAVLQALASGGNRESLEVLDLSDWGAIEPEFQLFSGPRTAVGDVSALWNTAPRLKSIRLRGADIQLGKIGARRLEELVIYSESLDARVLQSLATSESLALKNLELWFGHDLTGCTATLGDIAALLNGAGLPAVHRLGLCGTEFTDDVLGTVERSRLLPQLRTLNLSGGSLSSVGTRRLVDNSATYLHLDELVLHDNELSQEDQAAIRASLPNATLGTQRLPGERPPRYEDLAE